MSVSSLVPLGSTMFPSGNGLSTCPICQGRGVVTVPSGMPFPYPPGSRTCTCVLFLDMHEHLERQLPGTWAADPALCPADPSFTENWHIRVPQTLDVRYWIRKAAGNATIRPSMRPNIVSDSKILDASLGNNTGTGNSTSIVAQYYDPDTRWGTNVLIILLGMYSTPNANLNGYVEGVIKNRDLLSMPTWVVELETSTQSSGIPSMLTPGWKVVGSTSAARPVRRAKDL